MKRGSLSDIINVDKEE